MSFMLRDRDLPDPLWEALVSKAKADGWPLKKLLVQLAQDYVDGVIAPTAAAPIALRVVVIPHTCGGCTRAFEIHIRHAPGFSIMDVREARCPFCGTLNRVLLPGEVVTVEQPATGADAGE